jgi:hypothetical protein
MTDRYDDMRVSPDPSQAETLRQRLHERLASASRDDRKDRSHPHPDARLDPQPDLGPMKEIYVSVDSPTNEGRNRRRLAMAAAAAVAVIGVTGIAYAVGTSSGDDETPAPADAPTVAPTTVAPTTVAPTTVAPTTETAATDPPTVSEPPTTLALAALEAGRQFRVANVIVTIQCTATKSTPGSAMRDLVLGGVVTDNPDALATLDDVSVAMGDLLALIIREDPGGGRRVTLYDNTQWYGGAAINSCDELVESVPTWVDGGFFNADIPGGYEVLPGG